MPPVSLAFFWHQHQPYYPDRIGGENLMPWVRLHGTKDYWGMAWHIKEVPEFRCTINLVPSLLKQLLAYTEDGASDRHLDISRIPADGLGQTDGQYLLDHFFMANLDNMIRPYARYFELWQKRAANVDPVDRALKRFSERDLRDLQVWHNLTWFHPILFDVDHDLKAFLQKGQNWTEAEKQWLLQKQMEVLRQVIPLHRELAASGQVELTTTPFYHPILPLLWDKKCARQAMPGCVLPKHLESYQEDVVAQLRQAIDSHFQLFGSKPKGMWPSEGSVSQQIIPAIADLGIEWIATDEEILAESTSGWIARDSNGFLRNPELLYRPWKLAEQGRSLQIVFRDHALSDLIGFQYQRMNAEQAVGDLLGKVESIGRATEHANGHRPALVPIILDGENCWEYYRDGGVQFLRTLYQSCVARDTIRPVRIGEFLEDYPANDHISQLFAGSWISHNFGIWIGHQEDRTAWDLLHQTREFLKQMESAGKIEVDTLRRAWEEIYIAEGSDWFWWYGDDHSSAQDGLFDQLFRKHLKNVYILLRTPYPAQLDRPIGSFRQKAIHTEPKSFLKVKVDGRRSYFEWINAGRYVSGSERGTMTMVTQGLIREVLFGFDQTRFLLRIDTANRAIDDLKLFDELRITFAEPNHFELRMTALPAKEPQGQLDRDGRLVVLNQIEFAADQILELAVDLDDLRFADEARVEFSVAIYSEGKCLDRVPREGLLSMTTPTQDFELRMWLA